MVSNGTSRSKTARAPACHVNSVTNIIKSEGTIDAEYIVNYINWLHKNHYCNNSNSPFGIRSELMELSDQHESRINAVPSYLSRHLGLGAIPHLELLLQ